MNETENRRSPKLSDYLSIILKWKKFIAINVLLVAIITTGLVFLIPETYKATATVMIPPENSSLGLSGLSGLIGGKSSAASLGSKLFGITSTSEDVLLGILNSRVALTAVINKFNLMEYYEIDDRNIDKTLKAFDGDLSFETNEYGMIEVSVINKSPRISAQIANYFTKLLDSMNISLNIQSAKSNRIFVEKRYLQNVNDLKKAEDSLYNFQKKYGIVAVPEQLEVTVKAAAEIEALLTKKEMEAYFMLQQYGESSPQYQGISAEMNLLRKKVQELKSSPNLSATSNILFPFNNMPQISIQYLRAFREVEIQQAILEIVLPMYEQAKVEEQKSIPTIMIVDKAVPPQLKYGPKRMFLILLITFPFFFFLLLFVFRSERILFSKETLNSFEVKESSFYNKIQKIYKLKLR